MIFLSLKHMRAVSSLSIIFLISLAQAQQDQAKPFSIMTLIADSQSFIIGFTLFLIIAGLLYLDKRNGFRVITAIKSRIVNLVLRVQQHLNNKQKKQQKLATEQGSNTGKGMKTNIFDNQKSFNDIDLPSVQEVITNMNQETITGLQMEEEPATNINLKEIFDQKQGQNSSRRSKSKIKNRVQIKKSELESEKTQTSEQTPDQDALEASKTEDKQHKRL